MASNNAEAAPRPDIGTNDAILAAQAALFQQAGLPFGHYPAPMMVPGNYPYLPTAYAGNQNASVATTTLNQGAVPNIDNDRYDEDRRSVSSRRSRRE